MRHAFGSIRELLAEVSYSPMMGSYLTFLGSASFAASGSPPDENYARELMQCARTTAVKLPMTKADIWRPTIL